MREIRRKGLWRRWGLPVVGYLGLGLSSVLGCGGGNGNTNNAPVAQNDAVSVEEDTFDNPIDVLANDSDAEDGVPVLDSIVSGPSNGIAIKNGNQFLYTPNGDFNGIDSFTYRVKDSAGATNDGVVSITVNNVNDAPILSPLPNLVVEAGGLVDVDPVVFDADGDIPNFSFSAPLDSNGELLTTEDNIGNYPSLTVTVSDGNGGNDSGSFDLLVHSAGAGIDVGSNLEHLIICTSGNSTEFEKVRKWKTQKGVPSLLETVGNIVGSYGGRDGPEDIRNFIKQMKLANSNLKWILLDSDAPHREVYAECSLGAPFSPTFTMDSDLYFIDLDGTWDLNGNNIFGEMADGVEMYPDVFGGRLPVGGIQKLLNYEWGLIDMSKAKNVLFAAEMLSGTCDAKVRKALINGTAFPWQFDFTGNGFNLIGLYESDGTEDEDTVFDALNGGNLIANIYGHGSKDTIAVGSGSNQLKSDDISLGRDIRTLNNTLTPFILYVLGCNAGDFNNVSILNEFIKNPNGGAVACIGGSEAGLYNSSAVDGRGYSWDYDVRFFESLFVKGFYRLGEAFADSKINYVDESKVDSIVGKDYRWMQFCLNLFGDPEMNVWMDNAGDITATHLGGAGFTEVNVTNPIEAGLSVSVTKGNSVYETITNNNGKGIIPVSDPDSIVVAKPSIWVPFIYEKP